MSARHLIHLLVLLALLGCQRAAEPSLDAAPAPAAPAPPPPTVSGVLSAVTLTRAAGNLTRSESELVVLLSNAAALPGRPWIQLFPAEGPRRPSATGGPDERLNVPPGAYDVRISLRDGELALEGWARGVILAPGESAELAARLVAEVGELAVEPLPTEPLECIVRLDVSGRADATGQVVTRRPASTVFTLPTGKYRVALVRADLPGGSPVAEHTVEVRSGERAVIAPPVGAATGTLSVRVVGQDGTGALTDAAVVAIDGAGVEHPLESGSNTLPAGDYVVRVRAAPSRLVSGKVERSARVPASGSVSLELTVPIAFGRVRIVSEPAVPGCRVSARAEKGLDEVAAGEWLAVPRGEVDLTLRCPDRETRRFPGLIVEPGDKQTHTVRW